MSSSSEEEFNDDDDDDGEEEYNDNDNDDDDDDDDAEEEEEEEEEEESSSDDDEPLSSLKKSPDRKRPAVSYKEEASEEEEEEESSSDDDVPLLSLAKKKKKSPSPAKKKKAAATTKNGKKKKAAPAKKKKKTTTSKAKAPPKRSSSTVSATSNSNKSYEWASAALYGTECDKGLLIQRLLCRWWYAYEWPDKNDVPTEPPKNYDALDGFPGVFICTNGQDVGNIQDFRDQKQAPTFQNFAQKTSEELQELLIKAIENQKKELVQHEGPNSSTERELNEILKWTKKVNTNKADKEAGKVLKAQGLNIL